jgi:hypothetical protein
MMNANAASKGAGLPLGAVAVNVMGGLFIAAGLIGLFAPDVVKAVPALTDPTTAWSLVGVGIALDVGAALTLLGHVRARQQRSPA